VVLLWLRRYLLARIAVAGTVAGIFATWALAQFPYLIPPDLTISNAASPPSVMGPLLVSSIIGMIILLPSLWFLLTLFKARNLPAPHPSAEAYMKLLPPAPEPAEHAQTRPLDVGRTVADATRSDRGTARGMHLGRRAIRIAGLLALAVGFGTVAALIRRWHDERDIRSPATDM
ncbi:MAG: cytochrome d ubiquinol oxidase subunit II, partial [Ktedonobacterales bacterium]